MLHSSNGVIESSDKRKLERLQERGLRAVLQDKSSSYDLLNKAKLVTSDNHRLRNIAILMFKVKHGICPTYISVLCNLQTTQYSLRNSEFVMPRFKTVMYGKHFIKYLKLDRHYGAAYLGAQEMQAPSWVSLMWQMELSNLISNECGPEWFLCSSLRQGVFL